MQIVESSASDLVGKDWKPMPEGGASKTRTRAPSAIREEDAEVLVLIGERRLSNVWRGISIPSLQRCYSQYYRTCGDTLSSPNGTFSFDGT
jgi:hypothetical protein